MTEKEVLEMIKESAEKEKMPDALRPEQIKEKLQEIFLCVCFFAGCRRILSDSFY